MVEKQVPRARKAAGGSSATGDQLRKSSLSEKKTIWSACAFVALLVTVFFGVARPPSPGSYSFLMFTGLIAAGATGALIRSVIWGAEETAPITSLLLGGVAGFVVGMAYLIPQWVGAPGGASE